ncbi:MAG: trypsin-like peptidase domain-containing protein [Anaerohalosphaera sp.]|nr:trypsin-like peptidase domain-containing protein [Anaerohalosphaera sp.]
MEDSKILDAFTQKTIKLMESEGTEKIDILRSQLKRTFQEVSLKPISLQKKTPVKIYKECKPSVAVIGGIYKCGKCTKWHCEVATGFFISSSGVLMTNYHVVASGRSAAYCIMTSDGAVYGIKSVLAVDSVNDIAVLQIDGEGFKPLALSNRHEVGGAVTLISHPDNRFYTLTEGLISRYMFNDIQDKQIEQMQITADFARGSSGGPVFNEYGDVVGMVQSTNSIYYFQEKEQQRDLQMVIKNCIPSKKLIALVKKTTP